MPRASDTIPFYIDCIKAHPDRDLLRPFATVHAMAGNEALEEVRRAKGEGTDRAGRVVASFPRHRIERSVVDQIAGTCGRIKTAGQFTCYGSKVGALCPGRIRNSVWPILCGWRGSFPKTKFILAHWGGRSQRLIRNAVHWEMSISIPPPRPCFTDPMSGFAAQASRFET